MPACRTVLVVAHTRTYVQRLRDVFALLEADLRIQVVFTVAPHAFNEGTERYLEGLGVTVLPWEKAISARFDLALTAGSRSVEQLQAPVLRMSHGAGHIKLLREPEVQAADGDARPPGMLSRRQLTHGGVVVPAAVALAHERDRLELSRYCPEALPVTEVVGDSCYDRIVAGLPRRARYRRALGLTASDRLVLITSTWGPSSSFGQFGALLPRLLDELPAPRFRTAALVHPNVWSGHGDRQVRAWLSVLQRRGLAVVPPEADWQAPLISADWIVGDHGSVTTYGTLTGAPIVLARFPEGEVSASSPAARLARAVPALCPMRPVLEQLRYATETYRPAEHQRIADLLSSEPGRFHRRMRSVLYRLLRLGEPAFTPAPEPIPLPRPLTRWSAALSERSA